MQNTIFKFQQLLDENATYLPTIDKTVLEAKNPDKWSKKEILGHLVDSAVHNLVRFTEINYLEKPYHHRPYSQNDLVNLNQYQTMDINELAQIWLLLNKQIIRVFKNADEKALDYQIIMNDESVIDLKFLMTDYVEHLEYHILQIKA
ncbi:DinB family protein [Flavobacterium sp. ZT3R18]|uniref:DinB family protein n=1 Tax=Flavobacterium sp. ZT3R18 TaxID=2594429 RepID=UPI00117B5FA9|nr:DinB family protein [Flavobacterium sp. ZT3R18]TRX35765.1 DinB family protein [Flavobacterium sp. ZT3R18]